MVEKISKKEIDEALKGMAPKITKVTEELSCQLNEVEWQNRARELAEAQGMSEAEEQRKKDTLKQLGYDVSIAKNRVSKLASIVSSRHEQREVTVEIKHDYDLGIVTKVRTDTNEIISKRDMTTQEKQGDLFDDGRFRDADEVIGGMNK